jgi:hypothetical protein
MQMRGDGHLISVKYQDRSPELCEKSRTHPIRIGRLWFPEFRGGGRIPSLASYQTWTALMRGGPERP